MQPRKPPKVRPTETQGGEGTPPSNRQSPRLPLRCAPRDPGWADAGQWARAAGVRVERKVSVSPDFAPSHTWKRAKVLN